MTAHTCSRRMFLLGTASTFAGAVLVACGGNSSKAKELAASDVPVGGAKLFDGFLIAQPTAGEYKAYSSTCPHQGAEVSQIDGLKATCPKHQSVFDLHNGKVISGPSRADLTAAKVEKKGDNLAVSK